MKMLCWLIARTRMEGEGWARSSWFHELPVDVLPCIVSTAVTALPPRLQYLVGMARWCLPGRASGSVWMTCGSWPLSTRSLRARVVALCSCFLVCWRGSLSQDCQLSSSGSDFLGGHLLWLLHLCSVIQGQSVTVGGFYSPASGSLHFPPGCLDLLLEGFGHGRDFECCDPRWTSMDRYLPWKPSMFPCMWDVFSCHSFFSVCGWSIGALFTQNWNAFWCLFWFWLPSKWA